MDPTKTDDNIDNAAMQRRRRLLDAQMSLMDSQVTIPSPPTSSAIPSILPSSSSSSIPSTPSTLTTTVRPRASLSSATLPDNGTHPPPSEQASSIHSSTNASLPSSVVMYRRNSRPEPRKSVLVESSSVPSSSSSSPTCDDENENNHQNGGSTANPVLPSSIRPRSSSNVENTSSSSSSASLLDTTDDSLRFPTTVPALATDKVYPSSPSRSTHRFASPDYAPLPPPHNGIPRSTRSHSISDISDRQNRSVLGNLSSNKGTHLSQLSMASSSFMLPAQSSNGPSSELSTLYTVWENKLRTQSQSLEDRAKEVTKQYENHRLIEQTLQERQLQLDQRSSTLDHQEQLLRQRETLLQRNEEALTVKENHLQHRETVLAQQQQDVIQRQDTLANQYQQLHERNEKEFRQREDELTLRIGKKEEEMLQRIRNRETEVEERCKQRENDVRATLERYETTVQDQLRQRQEECEVLCRQKEQQLQEYYHQQEQELLYRIRAKEEELENHIRLLEDGRKELDQASAAAAGILATRDTLAKDTEYVTVLKTELEERKVRLQQEKEAMENWHQDKLAQLEQQINDVQNRSLELQRDQIEARTLMSQAQKLIQEYDEKQSIQHQESLRFHEEQIAASNVRQTAAHELLQAEQLREELHHRETALVGAENHLRTATNEFTEMANKYTEDIQLRIQTIETKESMITERLQVSEELIRTMYRSLHYIQSIDLLALTDSASSIVITMLQKVREGQDRSTRPPNDNHHSVGSSTVPESKETDDTMEQGSSLSSSSSSSSSSSRTVLGTPDHSLFDADIQPIVAKPRTTKASSHRSTQSIKPSKGTDPAVPLTETLQRLTNDQQVSVGRSMHETLHPLLASLSFDTGSFADTVPASDEFFHALFTVTNENEGLVHHRTILHQFMQHFQRSIETVIFTASGIKGTLQERTKDIVAREQTNEAVAQVNRRAEQRITEESQKLAEEVGKLDTIRQGLQNDTAALTERANNLAKEENHIQDEMKRVQEILERENRLAEWADELQQQANTLTDRENTCRTQERESTQRQIQTERYKVETMLHIDELKREAETIHQQARDEAEKVRVLQQRVFEQEAKVAVEQERVDAELVRTKARNDVLEQLITDNEKERETLRTEQFGMENERATFLAERNAFNDQLTQWEGKEAELRSRDTVLRLKEQEIMDKELEIEELLSTNRRQHTELMLKSRTLTEQESKMEQSLNRSTVLLATHEQELQALLTQIDKARCTVEEFEAKERALTEREQKLYDDTVAFRTVQTSVHHLQETLSNREQTLVMNEIRYQQRMDQLINGEQLLEAAKTELENKYTTIGTVEQQLNQTEENLRKIVQEVTERETVVTQREEALQENEAKLLRIQATVSHDETKLAEDTARLRHAEEAIELRSIQLDDQQAKLTLKQQELDELLRTTKVQRDSLETIHNARLDEAKMRETEAQLKEEILLQKTKAIEEEAAAATVRINEQKQRIEELFTQIAKERNELRQREDALLPKERELDQRTKELDDRRKEIETDYERRLQQYKDTEHKLQKRKIELDAFEKDTIERDEALVQREKQVEARETVVKKKEHEFSTHHSTMDETRSELVRERKEMDERLTRLSQRESLLAAREEALRTATIDVETRERKANAAIEESSNVRAEANALLASLKSKEIAREADHSTRLRELETEKENISIMQERLRVQLETSAKAEEQLALTRKEAATLANDIQRYNLDKQRLEAEKLTHASLKEVLEHERTELNKHMEKIRQMQIVTAEAEGKALRTLAEAEAMNARLADIEKRETEVQHRVHHVQERERKIIEDLAHHKAAVAAFETTMETHKQAVLRNEQDLQKQRDILSNQQTELNKKIAAVDEDHRQFARDKAELAARIATFEGQKKELENRTATIARKEVEIEAQRTEIANRLAEARTTAVREAEMQASRERSLQEARESLEAARTAHANELHSVTSSTRTREEELALAIKDLTIREESLIAAQLELKEAQHHLNDRAEEIRTNALLVEKDKQTIQTLRHDIERMRTEAIDMKTKADHEVHEANRIVAAAKEQERLALIKEETLQFEAKRLDEIRQQLLDDKEFIASTLRASKLELTKVEANALDAAAKAANVEADARAAAVRLASELEMRIADLDARDAAITKERVRVANEQAEMRHLQKELEALGAKLDEQRNELHRKEQEIVTMQETMERERQTLLTESHELRVRADALKQATEIHQREETEHRSTLRQEQEALADARRDLERREHSMQITVQEAEQKMHRAEELMTRLDKEKEHLAKLHETAENARKAANVAAEEAETMRRDAQIAYDEAKAKETKVTSALEEANKRLAMVKERESQIETQAVHVEQAAKRLENELLSLQNVRNHLQKREDEVDKRRIELDTEAESIRKREQVAKTKHADYVSQTEHALRTKDAELVRREQALEEREKQFKALRSRLETQKDEADTICKRITDESQRLNDLRTQLQEQERQVRLKERMVDESRQQAEITMQEALNTSREVDARALASEREAELAYQRLQQERLALESTKATLKEMTEAAERKRIEVQQEIRQVQRERNLLVTAERNSTFLERSMMLEANDDNRTHRSPSRTVSPRSPRRSSRHRSPDYGMHTEADLVDEDTMNITDPIVVNRRSSVALPSSIASSSMQPSLQELLREKEMLGMEKVRLGQKLAEADAAIAAAKAESLRAEKEIEYALARMEAAEHETAIQRKLLADKTMEVDKLLVSLQSLQTTAAAALVPATVTLKTKEKDDERRTSLPSGRSGGERKVTNTTTVNVTQQRRLSSTGTESTVTIPVSTTTTTDVPQVTNGEGILKGRIRRDSLNSTDSRKESTKKGITKVSGKKTVPPIMTERSSSSPATSSTTDASSPPKTEPIDDSSASTASVVPPVPAESMHRVHEAFVQQLNDIVNREKALEMSAASLAQEREQFHQERRTVGQEYENQIRALETEICTIQGVLTQTKQELQEQKEKTQLQTEMMKMCENHAIDLEISLKTVEEKYQTLVVEHDKILDDTNTLRTTKESIERVLNEKTTELGIVTEQIEQYKQRLKEEHQRTDTEQHQRKASEIEYEVRLEATKKEYQGRIDTLKDTHQKEIISYQDQLKHKEAELQVTVGRENALKDDTVQLHRRIEILTTEKETIQLQMKQQLYEAQKLIDQERNKKVGVASNGTDSSASVTVPLTEKVPSAPGSDTKEPETITSTSAATVSPSLLTEFQAQILVNTAVTALKTLHEQELQRKTEESNRTIELVKNDLITILEQKEEEITNLKGQITILQAQLDITYKEIESNRVTIQNKEQHISTLDEQINGLEHELTLAAQTLKELRKELAETKKKLLSAYSQPRNASARASPVPREITYSSNDDGTNEEVKETFTALPPKLDNKVIVKPLPTPSSSSFSTSVSKGNPQNGSRRSSVASNTASSIVTNKTRTTVSSSKSQPLLPEVSPGTVNVGTSGSNSKDTNISETRSVHSSVSKHLSQPSILASTSTPSTAAVGIAITKSYDNVAVGPAMKKGNRTNESSSSSRTVTSQGSSNSSSNHSVTHFITPSSIPVHAVPVSTASNSTSSKHSLPSSRSIEGNESVFVDQTRVPSGSIRSSGIASASGSIRSSGSHHHDLPPYIANNTGEGSDNYYYPSSEPVPTTSSPYSNSHTGIPNETNTNTNGNRIPPTYRELAAIVASATVRIKRLGSLKEDLVNDEDILERITTLNEQLLTIEENLQELPRYEQQILEYHSHTSSLSSASSGVVTPEWIMRIGEFALDLQNKLSVWSIECYNCTQDAIHRIEMHTKQRSSVPVSSVSITGTHSKEDGVSTVTKVISAHPSHYPEDSSMIRAIERFEKVNEGLNRSLEAREILLNNRKNSKSTHEENKDTGSTSGPSVGRSTIPSSRSRTASEVSSQILLTTMNPTVTGRSPPSSPPRSAPLTNWIDNNRTAHTSSQPKSSSTSRMTTAASSPSRSSQLSTPPRPTGINRNVDERPFSSSSSSSVSFVSNARSPPRANIPTNTNNDPSFATNITVPSPILPLQASYNNRSMIVNTQNDDEHSNTTPSRMNNTNTETDQELIESILATFDNPHHHQHHHREPATNNRHPSHGQPSSGTGDESELRSSSSSNGRSSQFMHSLMLSPDNYPHQHTFRGSTSNVQQHGKNTSTVNPLSYDGTLSSVTSVSRVSLGSSALSSVSLSSKLGTSHGDNGGGPNFGTASNIMHITRLTEEDVTTETDNENNFGTSTGTDTNNNLHQISELQSQIRYLETQIRSLGTVAEIASDRQKWMQRSAFLAELATLKDDLGRLQTNKPE